MSECKQTVVSAEAVEALARFKLPESLGFGKTMVPIMYQVDFEDGAWQTGRLLPYGPISVEPTAKVLHYAAEIFEGMKAFKVAQQKAQLFRPFDNLARLNNSARQLCMPDVPRDLFKEAVFTLVAFAEQFIPGDTGQSLYIRPFMIGTGTGLGLDVSSRFAFIIVASPSEDVFAGTMRVRIEREDSRVPIGGMGAAKAGANYAASLRASVKSADAGFNQTLWLDTPRREYVEELSGMNFFCVVDDVIKTPALGGTILPGITRDSVIQLARRSGIDVREVSLRIGDVIEQIQSGRCTEAFSCGTAAIIAPIELLGESDGSLYMLANTPGSVTQPLRKQLLDIQDGRIEDSMGWMMAIPESYYPDVLQSQ